LLDSQGFRELNEGGMVLGPLDHAEYQLGVERLEPGSLLALYTDGVIERFASDQSPFGEARVRSWMEDWREGPADRAVNDLIARLRGFGHDAPFADDVSVMLIRRLG